MSGCLHRPDGGDVLWDSGIEGAGIHVCRENRKMRRIRGDVMGRPLIINDEITIPGGELHMSFARSAGPGGQNVNKVNTKAVLHWPVAATPSLPDPVRRRLVERYSNRINESGELVIAADEYREQSRNVEACRDRLRQMVLSVLRPPRRRVRTRPPRGAVEKRLKHKRETGEKKRTRRFRLEE